MWTLELTLSAWGIVLEGVGVIYYFFTIPSEDELYNQKADEHFQ